jgi:hypothetical protein
MLIGRTPCRRGHAHGKMTDLPRTDCRVDGSYAQRWHHGQVAAGMQRRAECEGPDGDVTRFTLLLHLPRMTDHGHEARVKNGARTRRTGCRGGVRRHYANDYHLA